MHHTTTGVRTAINHYYIAFSRRAGIVSVKHELLFANQSNGNYASLKYIADVDGQLKSQTDETLSRYRVDTEAYPVMFQSEPSQNRVEAYLRSQSRWQLKMLASQ